jgi:putative redox protein
MSSDEAPGRPPTEEATLDRRVMIRTGRDRFRTDVMVRGHPLVADEPELLGGGDQGPTPYDLLCAALGSCTTITLRMYADRKGWPLEEVLASVTHRRETSAESGAPRDHFRLELEFRGDLSEEQRARLLEIADRCPVHRTLLGPSAVATRAKPP